MFTLVRKVGLYFGAEEKAYSICIASDCIKRIARTDIQGARVHRNSIIIVINGGLENSIKRSEVSRPVHGGGNCLRLDMIQLNVKK